MKLHLFEFILFPLIERLTIIECTFKIVMISPVGSCESRFCVFLSPCLKRYGARENFEFVLEGKIEAELLLQQFIFRPLSALF